MAGGGHLRAHAIIFFTTFLVGVCDTVVYPRAKLRVKRMRLSLGMAMTLFEAQGTRHRAHGKSKIHLKLPCALRLKPSHNIAFRGPAIAARQNLTCQMAITQAGKC